MKRFFLAVALTLAPVLCAAETRGVLVADIVDDHILPRFVALAESSAALSKMALQDCVPTSNGLRAAYGAAFDAWVSASHLRFGPTEVDDRAFALAFWPDSRGATSKALHRLVAHQDPIAGSLEGFAQVSIAARGFYAMEYLLYDDVLMGAGAPGYHCQLVQILSADIATTAQSILDDWETSYGATLKSPSPDGVYRSDAEALQALFKSLSTGLQFTSESRLGRPLGTFDRPRPNRSEARRSGRSAAHVELSLLSLQDLATRLAKENPDVFDRLNTSFARALTQLAALDDPTFAGVAAPQSRLKVEIIQQSVNETRTLVRELLGPTLGVAAGFNSLDGD